MRRFYNGFYTAVREKRKLYTPSIYTCVKYGQSTIFVYVAVSEYARPTSYVHYALHRFNIYNALAACRSEERSENIEPNRVDK